MRFSPGAMIRNQGINEVVGPHLSAAAAVSELFDLELVVLAIDVFFLACKNSRLENLEGELLVSMLIAAVDENIDASRLVNRSHCRLHLVLVLPTTSVSSLGDDLDISAGHSSTLLSVQWHYSHSYN